MTTLKQQLKKYRDKRASQFAETPLPDKGVYRDDVALGSFKRGADSMIPLVIELAGALEFYAIMDESKGFMKAYGRQALSNLKEKLNEKEK